ncbi:stage VI sporulation protein F [Jeotgalibacillus haloalkalitolerans]|uniref:Stage VI sporulation protein F n=1 Tax=Jeotgalibacillus haloalkalitolerans TaxID=3104292 RepID=A0ABU5KPA5_9BACL|nr:stage VI sporulation protein F [Jeotgalibacillus sp. HH7-29]MDZ5712982.1 stage VI sporulation protein F [Jeotgalibacillus sp. HH7-29]
MNDAFFKKIENKTGVKMDQLFELANAFQHADFNDEQTVKKLVRQVASAAGKPITKDMEEKIAKTVTAKGEKIDYQTLSNMINKK